MHLGSRTLLAWLVFLATFACLAGGLVVTLLVTRPLTTDAVVDGAFDGAIWLLFASVGLVLTLRRPANPIGWLYAAAGLVWTLYIPWDPWVDQLLRSGRPLPPAARLAALAGDSLWAVGITLAITLPLLLLPDGRLRSPRWRPVAVAAIAGTAMSVVGWSLAPEPMTQTLRPVAKPFPLHGVAGAVAGTVGWIGWGMLFACVPAAAACVVLRFRASRGVERQQLRWVVAGAAVAGAAPLVLLPLGLSGLVPEDAFAIPLLLSVPTAIAVAVLRYRLWDLDRLVSRTVTYALVTALLVIPYLLILPVDAFAVRLRDQVDLGALHTELLAVVDQTMQPTQASLWLRPPAVGPALPR
jgi:hypothetical protein